MHFVQYSLVPSLFSSLQFGMKAEQTDISSRSPSEMETDASGTVPSLASCDFIDEWEMPGEGVWSSPGSG